LTIEKPHSSALSAIDEESTSLIDSATPQSLSTSQIAIVVGCGVCCLALIGIIVAVVVFRLKSSSQPLSSDRNDTDELTSARDTSAQYNIGDIPDVQYGMIVSVIVFFF
jgi:hypothetical protein